MVEKQFPAPNRRFVGGKASKTTKKQKTKSPSRAKSSHSSRLTQKSTDPNVRRTRNPANKSRVIYSEDSDEDDSDKKMHVVVLDSDDEDDFKGKFFAFV